MRSLVGALMSLVVVMAAACDEPDPTPVVQQPTGTATPSTALLQPPTATAVPVSSATPTPEAPAPPTSTPTASPSPVPAPPDTPAPSPTDTPGATHTPTSTPQPTATRTPGPTHTPAPAHATATPTALEVLEATAAAMESVDSFHLDMDMRMALGAGGTSIQVPITVVADFLAPDRSRGTLSMSLLFFTIKSQFVTIGDTNYVTDPDTGEWGLAGDTVMPVLDPDAFIRRGAIAEVRGLEMLGAETLESIDVYHLAGALTPDVIGEAGASGDVMVSYWIGVEDSLVRLIEANGDIRLDSGGESLFGFPADSASLSMTMTFSDYGKPITIEAPEVASTGAPPTPTPTPESRPVGPQPPPSVGITGPDEAQQGVTQSYFGGGAFIDYLGRGYPSDEVSLVQEALLVSRLDSDEAPQRLVMYVYPEGTGAGPLGRFPDSFLSRVDVPMLPSDAGAVSILPGAYEVTLHAEWEDLQANYGFSVILPSRFRVAARTSNSPTTLTPAPPAPAGMAQPRSDHTATLLVDGRVLVTGDLDIELNALFSVEVHDAASGKWSPRSAMSEARRDHRATLLPNGRVLVAGGHGIDAEIHASAEIFDPSAETWTSAGDMSEARLRHTATLLQNGRVLVVAGSSNTAEIYDPSSGTWTVTDGMAHWRDFHTATLLDDGSFLVAGGVDNAVSVLAGADIYDPNPGDAINTIRIAEAD